MRRRLCYAAVFGSCLAGCSLLVDTTGLAGTPDGSDVGAETCTGDACAPVGADGSQESAADSGPADSDGSAASPCPAFAIFCEDFEKGTLDKFSSIEKSNAGDVSIVMTPVHMGARAMRAFGGINAAVDGSVPQSEANAVASLGPPKTGLVVVRAYVYLPKALAGTTTIFKISAASGDDMNVKLQAPSGLLSVDTDTAGSGPDQLATKVPPYSKWFCLEWRATLGTNGHHTLILDGTTILDADENTFTAGGYDQLHVGFTAAGGASAHEVFYDDLAIATQPLPCP